MKTKNTTPPRPKAKITHEPGLIRIDLPANFHASNVNEFCLLMNEVLRELASSGGK